MWSKIVSGQKLSCAGGEGRTSGGVGARYVLRTAQGRGELEAVFRFRYEHFFKHFEQGYPGLDHAGGCLFEPHDENSFHYCAFTSEGRLCAVCTGTPAAAADIPDAWREWLRLERIARLGLRLTVVTTRMVIHLEHRRTELFELFYRFLMEQYLQAGFAYSVHYCSPALVRRYEGLGHRLYGEPFIVPPGMVRTPMFFALNDLDHLRRLRPLHAELCAAHALPPPVVPLPSVLPELDAPNFRLLSSEERLGYVQSRLGPIDLPGGFDISDTLEHASVLRLGRGLAQAAYRGCGFPCLILRGAVREQGKERAAGPGSFIGADLLADPDRVPLSFVVEEDAEVLVFDRGYINKVGQRLLGVRAIS